MLFLSKNQYLHVHQAAAFQFNKPYCFNPINPIPAVARQPRREANQPTKPCQQNCFLSLLVGAHWGLCPAEHAVPSSCNSWRGILLQRCGMTDGFLLRNYLLRGNIEGCKWQIAKSWRAAPNLHVNLHQFSSHEVQQQYLNSS